MQQNHEEDDFDNGADGRLNEHAEDMGDFARKLLTSESDEVGTRCHGNVGENEDEDVIIGEGIWTQSSDLFVDNQQL